MVKLRKEKCPECGSGHQGKAVLLPDGTSLETWVYVPIQHPSSGFSWDFWHEAIMGFLGGQL